jgi:F-type H+-transporting ATPase subunit delta
MLGDPRIGDLGVAVRSPSDLTVVTRSIFRRRRIRGASGGLQSDADPKEREHVAQDGVDLSGVAGRYAFALHELASEQSATEAVSEALKAFRALFDESADLRRLVQSPAISAAEQLKALNALLPAAGIAGIAANFIRLVASKRRLFALPGIIDAYERLEEKAKGLVRAEATVAKPLLPSQELELRQALAAAAGGKTVNLDVKTDPSIIGGIVVKLGSRMVDASLKTKLNSIRTRMKEVG